MNMLGAAGRRGLLFVGWQRFYYAANRSRCKMKTCLRVKGGAAIKCNISNDSIPNNSSRHTELNQELTLQAPADNFCNNSLKTTSDGTMPTDHFQDPAVHERKAVKHKSDSKNFQMEKKGTTDISIAHSEENQNADSFHPLNLNTVPLPGNVVREPTENGEIGGPLKRRHVEGSASVYTKEQAQMLSSGILKEIWDLALPTLGTVLSDPLMSLIDTGCIGQLGSLQLAALGPNVSIFNFIFQVFNFLGAATCNILAGLAGPEINTEGQLNQREQAEKLLGHALVLAVVLGTMVMLAMEVLGHQLLVIMGASGDFIGPALSYLRIRALSVPAVLVMVVAQGACLALQDAKTPLRIYAAAALVNLVGDYVLTLRAGWGVAGAAVTTLCAQMLAVVLFIKALRGSSSQARLSSGDTNQQGASPTFVLHFRWHGFPTRGSIRPFLDLAVPLIMRSVLGMAVYTMTARAAAGGGAVEMAGHQVAMQCFWTLSYFVEPLSLAAQSLIARDLVRDRQRVCMTARMLVLFAALMGLLLALALAGLSFGCSSLLTSDPAVTCQVASLLPQSMICMFFCSLTMALDGVAIACGEVGYIAQAQLVNLAFVACSLAIVQRLKMGLCGIWWCLVLFFGTRVAAHALHIGLSWPSHIIGGGDLSKLKAA